MSRRFLTIHQRSLGNRLLSPRTWRDSAYSRRREILLLVLAFCSFALPLLLVPFTLGVNATERWFRAGLPGSAVQELLIPAGAQDLRYALAVHRGVYRSGEDAMRWTAANNGVPFDRWGRAEIYALAADETNPALVYAGRRSPGPGVSTLASGLYWSDDRGATWLSAGRDFAGQEVQTIAVMPAPLPYVLAKLSGQVAYEGETRSQMAAEVKADAVDAVCVATTGEIYRSIDAGRSWEQLGWRGVETRILSLAFGPGRPDTIYAGAEGSGLYKTVDGGASWRTGADSLQDLSVYDIAVAVARPEWVYLATDRGVFKSTDDAATWSQVTGPTVGRTVRTVALHPYNEMALCVGLDHGGVYCSADGGMTWVDLHKGMGSMTTLSLQWDPHSLVTLPRPTDDETMPRPTDGETLWAGTVDGIWRYEFSEPFVLNSSSTGFVDLASPMSVSAFATDTQEQR